MKHWRSWKLITKLVVSFTVLFATSFILSGIFYYYSSVNELKRQSMQLLVANTDQITRSLDLYSENLEKLSLSVFNDPIVQKAMGQDNDLSALEQANLTQQVSSHLLNLSISWPAVQGIYLFSNRQAELTYYWSKRSPPVGYSVTQEPWYPYDQYSKHQPFLLWPTMKENTITNFTGEQVFSLVRAMNQIPTGKRIGYMKIDIHSDVFKDLVSFQENRNTPGTLLFVINDQNQVVYDKNDVLTGKKITNLSIRSLNQDNTAGQTDWQGQSYLYGIGRSDYTGWTTLILTPMSDITGKLQIIRNTVMGIEFVVLLLVMVIGSLIARSITRPLRHMIITMKHVERGDFSVRAEQTGNQNEIGLMSKVFNQMLDSLQTMITKVYMAEIRERDARLVALQAQINPHFLFNTLTILKSLGRKGASEDVVNVTESLAHLFRYSLYDWDRTVELREEMELVGSYIRIQKYRFQERITFHIDIPEHIQQARVLRLMIQPLVENAVVHGLERRKSGGWVSVKARINGERLEIRVEDNGSGIDEDKQATLKQKLEMADSITSQSEQSEHMGIALINIQSRMRLIYGDCSGLTFEQTCEEGITFILTLPLVYEGRERQHDHHAD
ncbi:sensor histidine kinase [Paenibacillus silvae]|nr:sensor histidine kinase [Paenibacillus silvae]